MHLSQNEGTLIDKMLQNAHEKAFEILLLGQKQAQKIKKDIYETRKQELNIKYQEQHRKLIAANKIFKSSLINQHRMKRIKVKYQLCENIFREVERRLQHFTTDKSLEDQYKLFLIKSILEGLVRMFEQDISIRCLKKDQSIINQILPQCKHAYDNFMREEVGRQYPLNIKIAQNVVLAERNIDKQHILQKKLEDQICIGGVILADSTGNIIFKSTIDSRINILKELCLPDIRKMIWEKKLNNGKDISSPKKILAKSKMSGQKEQMKVAKSAIK